MKGRAVPERALLSGPWEAFGAYLKAQRQLAQLSLRQLSERTGISNPYLSQIERGLHQPSISVIKSLAEALDLSVEQVLAHAAGTVAPPTPSTESAIRADPRLTEHQRAALLAVYRSMVEGTPSPRTARPARKKINLT
jgi:transcriptional regulator with XRE-family HTH domain